jgi:tRNA(Leu) C34 or U34 (ribose-2'-O)-methylase TrmL
VESAKIFLDENHKRYRKVATVVQKGAKEILDFKYGPNDLLVFGDERN